MTMIEVLPEDRPSTGRETWNCKKNKVAFSALWNAFLTGWALFCWEDYYIVSGWVLYVDSKRRNNTVVKEQR